MYALFAFRYYLQIVACAEGSETHSRWSGTVESKIRQLVMKLENNASDSMLDIAHPFIRGFEQSTWCVGPEEVNRAAAGEASESGQEGEEGREGGKRIWTTSFYIGLEIKAKLRE